MLMDNYMIGYGSLINQKSRQASSPSSYDVIAVKIAGYTRGWFARTGVVGYSTTYLGCLRSSSNLLEDKARLSFMNCILYKVEANELEILDRRERRYKRRLVKREDITGYNNEIPKNANFWIFENDFNAVKEFNASFPNKEYPIIQSYVDMCLEGCIILDESLGGSEFTNDFFDTTIGWNNNWANDRVYPRRPQSYCKYAYDIDDLLVKHLGIELFNSIYLE